MSEKNGEDKESTKKCETLEDQMQEFEKKRATRGKEIEIGLYVFYSSFTRAKRFVLILYMFVPLQLTKCVGDVSFSKTESLKLLTSYCTTVRTTENVVNDDVHSRS